MPKCVKNPCSICKFRVHNNHKAIFCNICHLWTHLKCTPLSLSEYNDLTHFHDDCYCPSCLSDTFPFNHFDSDTDFYFALLDLQSSANFDSCLLGTKYFNLFLEDPDTYQLLHNSDLDPSRKIQKPNLGLPQGSKTLVVGSTLSINNIVIILHKLTKLYIPNSVTNTTI